jgi:hypothetical protein
MVAFVFFAERECRAFKKHAQRALTKYGGKLAEKTRNEAFEQPLRQPLS